MGGGGGSRYSGPASDNVRRKLDNARRQEQERLVSAINELLQSTLVQYNDRDREAISSRLDQIQEILGEEVQIDKVLYGGSVAKHTDVDGISDTDALVLLDGNDFDAQDPAAVLERFHEKLATRLPRQEIDEIRVGRVAVTIAYRDGEEVQLLPALRRGDTVSVPNETGREWRATRPIAFQKALTNANDSMNGALVPSIKLVKSIVDQLPPAKQLKSHHIETLAVDAVRDYRGPKTPRALVLQILEHSSNRVLAPMPDITGQVSAVDSALGEAGSASRRAISVTMGALKRRLDTATSVGQWRAVLGLQE